MLHSMTGYATKNLVLTTPDESKSTLSIHLKSLNSRFFEASCKLPQPLAPLETEFIRLFKKHLHRGRVFFTIYLNNQHLQGNIEPATKVVGQYLNALNKIQKTYDLDGSLAINDIMRLPNIFLYEEKGINNQIKKEIFSAVNELIEQLIKEQKKEGSAIEKDLLARCKQMKKEIDAIEKTADSIMAKRKKEVAKKLADIGKDEQFSQQRSALYYELDKMDIHEEIVRFKSHLINFQDILASKNIEKGRRLDFTLQELARETNTISAKSSEASISSKAINLKVEIEKAREQIQNIV